MGEPAIVNEWRADAVLKATRRMVLKILHARFGPALPSGLIRAVETNPDQERLDLCVERSVTGSLGEVEQLPTPPNGATPT